MNLRLKLKDFVTNRSQAFVRLLKTLLSHVTNHYKAILITVVLGASIFCYRGQLLKLVFQNQNGTGYFLSQCNCTKHLKFNDGWPKINLTGNLSTCSEEADWLGKNQKVLSYGLHNDPKGTGQQAFAQFIGGIAPNVQEIRRLYPGWYMRIYSNLDLDPHLCLYVCWDEVIWCDVRQARHGELAKVNPRMWRFIPLGDPLVDTFVSRDLDSLVNDREREGVEDWENTTKIFHCARDGHMFERAMSAGAWGAKNHLLKANESTNLRNEFVKLGINKTSATLDEDLLQALIYNRYKPDILSHDSYSCARWARTGVLTIPFPKQRKSRFTRVAKEIRRIGIPAFQARECPYECRPCNGRNWTYC